MIRGPRLGGILLGLAVFIAVLAGCGPKCCVDYAFTVKGTVQDEATSTFLDSVQVLWGCAPLGVTDFYAVDTTGVSGTFAYFSFGPKEPTCDVFLFLRPGYHPREVRVAQHARQLGPGLYDLRVTLRAATPGEGTLDVETDSGGT